MTRGKQNHRPGTEDQQRAECCQDDRQIHRMTHIVIRTTPNELVILIQRCAKSAGDAEHATESPIAPQVQSNAGEIQQATDY